MLSPAYELGISQSTASVERRSRTPVKQKYVHEMWDHLRANTDNENGKIA